MLSTSNTRSIFLMKAKYRAKKGLDGPLSGNLSSERVRFNEDINDRAPFTPPKRSLPVSRLSRAGQHAASILQNRTERSPVAHEGVP